MLRAGLGKWVLGAGKIAVLLGVLCATFLVVTITTLQISLKNREVPVPSINGLTPSEAETVLADAGLTMQIAPLRHAHRTISIGRIAEQDPSSGLATRRRRSVKVWLSSGQTPDRLPLLIGASDQAAIRHLEENTFKLDGLAEIRSNRYPIDSVVAQHQSSEGDGQRVSLLVNRGERGFTYVMPDLIGVDNETAEDVMRSRGFRVTVVANHPYPGVPPGIVLRQSPESGFQVAPGEPISLEVSQ